MYTISNRQMEEAVRYIEMFRERVDPKRCDLKTYNAYRMAGNLLKRLKAKRPVEKFSASE